MRLMMLRLLPLLAIATFVSCASSNAPTPLAGHEWQVEDLAGAGVIDRAMPTMQFDGDGQVTGSTGCNRFFGSYRQDGDRLAIGDVAQTKRACPDAVMEQERRFLELLQQVRSVRREGDDLLVIETQGGDIRLAPAG